MSLFKIFDIAGSGMSAQSVRLNVTASNLANAQVAASSAGEAYKSRHPVFSAVMDEYSANNASSGVKVDNIIESQAPPQKLFQPDNPMADKEGYVYMPNVNMVEEMANMISASRSFQSNVEVLNTTKQLMLRTLQLGQ
jgi:flagellar basal-body rod protein FlgC